MAIFFIIGIFCVFCLKVNETNVSQEVGLSMFEVELKFPVDSHDSIRQQLKAMEVVKSLTSEHSDEYFNHSLLDFAAQDIALRIRSRDNHNVLTYKGPNLDQRAKVREEIELDLNAEDKSKFRQMLLGMGFHSVASVLKKRDSISIVVDQQAIEICLDDVEGVGTFVELEQVVSDKSEIESAKAHLESLASVLSITSQPTTVSYLEMLLDASE